MRSKLALPTDHRPQLLLGELHASFSRNDGNFLEALHPGLLSAVADVAEAAPKDDRSQGEAGTSSSRRGELKSPPVTWEEVRATTIDCYGGKGARRWYFLVD